MNRASVFCLHLYLHTQGQGLYNMNLSVSGDCLQKSPSLDTVRWVSVPTRDKPFSKFLTTY